MERTDIISVFGFSAYTILFLYINLGLCQKMEGSEILSYLQDKKLCFHSFIDTGRRHETPGSESKGFIMHDIAGSIDFMVVSVLELSIPIEKCEGVPGGCWVRGLCHS